MDEQVARALRDLNTRFYAQAADSFGGTRHNRWPGWERLLEVPGVAEVLGDTGVATSAGAGSGSSSGSVSGSGSAVVTDLACGNLRFETFLERAFPGTDFVFQAVDNTEFPVWEQGRGEVRHYAVDLLDVPRLCVAGRKPADLPNGSDLVLEPADLAVSFGFLHHVPGFEQRVEVLRMLLDCVRSDGFAAVSFWRFLDEPSLAKRVIDPREVPALVALGGSVEESGGDFAALDLEQLEPGDAFLGWDNQPGLVRYCHSFSDEEIDALVAALAVEVSGVQVRARYRADGRSGALNEYVVWQRGE